MNNSLGEKTPVFCGIFPMDYFRRALGQCDPFFINRQIYFLSGFGTLNSPVPWKNFLYAIYRSYCFFVMTLTFVIQVLDIYLLIGDLAKLSEDLCAIIVTIVTVVKMYLMAFRMHKFIALQEEFMRFRRSRIHPDDEKIWSNASVTIYNMVKIFYALGASCVVFWIIFPVADGTPSDGNRKLPYPWVFFVDQYQTPYYEIIYVAQSISLFSFLVNIISVDLGYSSYIVLLIAQHEILSRDIAVMSSAYDGGQNVDGNAQKEKSRRSMKALSDVVKIHNNITRQRNKLQEIHSDLLFIQMSNTALMIAMVVVDIIINSGGLSLKLFQRLLYTAGAIFDSFIMCYWGTQLREKGMEFATNIYNCNWVEMDGKVRKMLLFMIVKAQNTAKLRNGIYIFELPLFLDIIQLAYNAAALLHNTT